MVNGLSQKKTKGESEREMNLHSYSILFCHRISVGNNSKIHIPLEKITEIETHAVWVIKIKLYF